MPLPIVDLISAVRRRARPQYIVVALTGLLLLAYGASTFIALHRAHQQALDGAAATLESVTRSIAIGSDQPIIGVDTTLIRVPRILAALLPDKPLSDPEVTVLLRQLARQNPDISDLVVLDPQGHVVNGARLREGRSSWDGTGALVAAGGTGAIAPLAISRPVRDRAAGGGSIILSRPLLRRGKSVGIVAAEMPVSVFVDFFKSVVGGDTSVALMFDDGTLLAATPNRAAAIGQRAPGASRILQAATGQAAGLIRSAAGPGGRRLLSYRRIAGRPLIITVARARADVLRQWWQECESSLAAFGLFAVTAGMLTALAVGGLSRQQRATLGLRASEAQLKRQSELLQSTLENMGEGISVFDRAGYLLACNSRFLELLELPRDITTRRSLYDILEFQTTRGDFGSDRPELGVAERFERAFRDVPLVRERLLPSGRTVQIRRQEMPGGIVTLYSDITDRKATERRMAQARARAELANRAKSDFLANMSHELRTPLNAIVGFSEVVGSEMLGPADGKKYLEYVRDIHASGLHLLSIVNDVLDMAKIESGKLDLASEPVDVSAVVAETLRMVREQAAQRNIELKVAMPDAAIGIVGDERAIKQALLNILSNAVKFSRPGGSVAIRAAHDDLRGLELEIEDHGIGMTEDELVRALQPFEQAKSGIARAYGGTGLGLPLAKGLIEAHGGTLTVESREGEGTRVRILLPARLKSPAMSDAEIAEAVTHLP